MDDTRGILIFIAGAWLVICAIMWRVNAGRLTSGEALFTAAVSAVLSLFLGAALTAVGGLI